MIQGRDEGIWVGEGYVRSLLQEATNKKTDLTIKREAVRMCSQITAISKKQDSTEGQMKTAVTMQCKWFWYVFLVELSLYA